MEGKKLCNRKRVGFNFRMTEMQSAVGLNSNVFRHMEPYRSQTQR